MATRYTVRPSEITALHTGPAGELVDPIPESLSDGPVTIGACGDSIGARLASRRRGHVARFVCLDVTTRMRMDCGAAPGVAAPTCSLRCNCSRYGVAVLSGRGKAACSRAGNTCNSATGGETTDASSQPPVSAAAAINVTCFGRMDPSLF